MQARMPVWLQRYVTRNRSNFVTAHGKWHQHVGSLRLILDAMNGLVESGETSSSMSVLPRATERRRKRESTKIFWEIIMRLRDVWVGYAAKFMWWAGVYIPTLTELPRDGRFGRLSRYIANKEKGLGEQHFVLKRSEVWRCRKGCNRNLLSINDMQCWWWFLWSSTRCIQALDFEIEFTCGLLLPKVGCSMICRYSLVLFLLSMLITKPTDSLQIHCWWQPIWYRLHWGPWCCFRGLLRKL